MYDLSDYEEYDLQHDLAMALADGETIASDDLNQAFYNELVRRGAEIPINCRWEYNIYAYGRLKLHFDLGDPHG